MRDKQILDLAEFSINLALRHATEGVHMSGIIQSYRQSVNLPYWVCVFRRRAWARLSEARAIRSIDPASPLIAPIVAAARFYMRESVRLNHVA